MTEQETLAEAELIVLMNELSELDRLFIAMEEAEQSFNCAGGFILYVKLLSTHHDLKKETRRILGDNPRD